MTTFIDTEKEPVVCPQCGNNNPYIIGVLNSKECDRCLELWEINSVYREEM